MKTIKLDTKKLEKIREVNPRLVSYNVEMTEVTGGTFWKPYTQAQIDGTEKFPQISDLRELQGLMSVYAPIDLTKERIVTLAKELGPAYVRVSGSWATNTYYDFEGTTNGVVPEGFQAVLTKEQWNGVLDFVKKVDAELLVSVANTAGVHNEDGTWSPEQAKLLFDHSIEYGVPINASEFMNEPNAFFHADVPKGYTIEDFNRDQDDYFRFIKKNYPEVLTVGPCACGDDVRADLSGSRTLHLLPTEPLIEGCKEKADVFSYHYYAGLSERGASIGFHWNEEDALTESYLNVASDFCEFYAKIRDKYCPGGEMWVTESADAGCGGNTWGSTYLDVIRYADEIARFCTITNGIIFHNTLASSSYGLLDHHTFEPRPNYWLALLWRRLMGTTVYDTKEAVREGVHFYCHSRGDGKDGYAYILINNSKEESTFVELDKVSERYTLSGEKLRSSKMLLNGEEINLVDGQVPEFVPVMQEAGVIELKPATVTFLLVE